MYGEKTLLKVIARLMVQIEEEKRRRSEAIHICLMGDTSIDITPPKQPSDEEINKRIEELSDG